MSPFSRKKVYGGECEGQEVQKNYDHTSLTCRNLHPTTVGSALPTPTPLVILVTHSYLAVLVPCICSSTGHLWESYPVPSYSPVAQLPMSHGVPGECVAVTGQPIRR